MKKFFTENIGLKITAVLLSVFLWFFVTSRGQSEISLDIPVEVKNVPETLGLMPGNNKTVSITVKGQERLMKNLKPSDIRVLVDLGKAKTGEGVYYINKDDIKAPYAITVTNVTPSALKFKLDEQVTKTVPVKPEIVGTPKHGFSVTSVEITPRQVVIQGLRSEVRKINALKTEELDVSGFDETVSKDMNIDFSGANIRSDITSVIIKVVLSGRKK